MDQGGFSLKPLLDDMAEVLRPYADSICMTTRMPNKYDKD